MTPARPRPVDRRQTVAGRALRALLPLALLALGSVGVAALLPPAPIDPGPGRVAPSDPTQGPPAGGSIRVGRYRLEPLASFEMTARVLARERYWFDKGAELVPLDVAFGWGPMSDGAVLAGIEISQGFRFYRWRVRDWPIPREEIERHSANMHLIPATDGVRRAILDLPVGAVVHLRGALVTLEEEGSGWRWTSSVTRSDTGPGACELIWVTSLTRVTPPAP